MNGIHEVRGSIPLDSTKFSRTIRQAKSLPFLFCPLVPCPAVFQRKRSDGVRDTRPSRFHSKIVSSHCARSRHETV